VTYNLNFTESGIQTALRTFLTTILPPGTPVIRGQANRVAEPVASDFVVMWPLYRERVETNIDLYADTLFTGSITGGTSLVYGTLTVSALTFGTIIIGNLVWGSGLNISGNQIYSQISGSVGGTGVYSIGLNATIGSELMAAGNFFALQPTLVTYQLDVHGPNSGNNTQVISTLFRDFFAVNLMAQAGGYYPLGPYNEFGGQTVGNALIAPVDADEPRQIPFINDQQQYEDRWVLHARMLTNQIVDAPQQYFGQITIQSTGIDTTPPVTTIVSVS
jgi:hypothetical protein